MPRYRYQTDGTVDFQSDTHSVTAGTERDYVLYNQAGTAVDITIEVGTGLRIETVDPNGRTGILADGDIFRLGHDGVLTLSVTATGPTAAFEFTSGLTSHGTTRSSGSGHTLGHQLDPEVILAQI